MTFRCRKMYIYRISEIMEMNCGLETGKQTALRVVYTRPQPAAGTTNCSPTNRDNSVPSTFLLARDCEQERINGNTYTITKLTINSITFLRMSLKVLL
jgi:hypothetical protein